MTSRTNSVASSREKLRALARRFFDTGLYFDWETQFGCVVMSEIAGDKKILSAALAATFKDEREIIAADLLENKAGKFLRKMKGTPDQQFAEALVDAIDACELPGYWITKDVAAFAIDSYCRGLSDKKVKLALRSWDDATEQRISEIERFRRELVRWKRIADQRDKRSAVLLDFLVTEHLGSLERLMKCPDLQTLQRLATLKKVRVSSRNV